MASSSTTARLSLLSILALSGCPDGRAPYTADASVLRDAPQPDANADTGDAPVPDAPLPDANSDVGAVIEADAGSERVESFEVIGERTATLLDRAQRVELIRGTRRDGEHTYLLYIHAATANAPVVIVNQPYAGIDWTGEAIDARWAALGAGHHPDVDAPAYDGNDTTVYGAQTVQAAVDESLVWVFNGAAVVHVYGRFYAGGTLLDDAEDAAMGYAFVASRSGELDASRIGGFGSSWGAMMTLFGAARARDAHARALSMVAPPSDFVDLYQHSIVEVPGRIPDRAVAEAFFSPYWRRATPSIGYPPSATDPRAIAFTPAGICAALPTNTLVLHDDWDVLIPVRETEALAASCAGKVRPMLWRRGALNYATASLDHGPISSEGNAPSVMTFSALHLLHNIMPGSVTAIGSAPSLRIFLELMRDALGAGENIDWVYASLRQLADTRTQLFDPDTAMFTPGGEVLATAFNPVFGTSLTPAELRAELATRP